VEQGPAGSPVATLVRVESTHSTLLDEIMISYCSVFGLIYLSPKRSTACERLPEEAARISRDGYYPLRVSDIAWGHPRQPRDSWHGS
jgi:hypothetical protein